MPKIKLVVPVFNRAEKITQLFLDLAAQEDPDFSVIVVDHGTQKITAFPSVSFHYEVVERPPSDWYASAINAGLNHLLKNPDSYTHCLLLNDDVRLPVSYVSNLKHCIERLGDRSVLGSVVINEENHQIFERNVTLNWWIAKRNWHGKGASASTLSGDYETEFLSGRGVCYPIQCLKEMGVMNDHQFPQYGGDYEFARRAKKNGYSLIVPSVLQVGLDTQSTGLNLKVKSVPFKTRLASLFSIRSPSNLKIKPAFALKCVPNYWVLPSFFVCDVLRGIIGTLRPRA